MSPPQITFIDWTGREKELAAALAKSAKIAKAFADDQRTINRKPSRKTLDLEITI
jgi:hypothetical protein